MEVSVKTDGQNVYCAFPSWIEQEEESIPDNMRRGNEKVGICKLRHVGPQTRLISKYTGGRRDEESTRE